MSIKALQEYTTYSRYAEYIPEKKRRETWVETCDRMFNDMHLVKFKDKIAENPDLKTYIDEAHAAIKSKRILGSQRALQFGGDPILKHNAKMFNCAFGHACYREFFNEALYLLLAGCGVGFSVQKHHVEQLPAVYDVNPTMTKLHVIEDSIEGWADAIKVLMASYFDAGHTVEFDYDLIRPEGSTIAGRFKAPGPDGLHASIEKIREVVELCLTSPDFNGKLDTIHVYDIMMHLSDAVLSGGVRRCLSEDQEVQMGDGSWKLIGEITVGETILYAGKEYPVTETFNNGVKDTVQISTLDGYHVSTPNHKWLVDIGRGPEWKTVEEFNEHNAYMMGDNGYHNVVMVAPYGEVQTYDIEVADIHRFNTRHKDSKLSCTSHNSATIALFSMDDDEMMSAKTGNWFIENPQRGRSNNSAVLVRSESKKEDFMAVKESVRQFGEPGFVFLEDKECGVNPCCEIVFRPVTDDGRHGFQFCNLSTINGKKANTPEKFYQACREAAIIGTLQAAYTDFKYVSTVTRELTEYEALLGVSITGVMDSPDVTLDPDVQKEGARIVKATNKKMAKLLGINQAARTTCVKPEGSSSCILGTASGIHPHHAKRYLRRVQANKMEFPVQYFNMFNPQAVEESVWSANKTDNVITFLCEVPKGSVTKNQLSAIELLDNVKSTQQNWVSSGTNRHLGFNKEYKLRHNVSNTITVREDEWDGVFDYLWKNKKNFTGVSLLPINGDKDYAQAPFCTIYDEKEIAKEYGAASMFASGMITAGLRAFDNNLWQACSVVLGVEELIEPVWTEPSDDAAEVEYELICDEHDDAQAEYENKLDWIRRGQQFADRYFDGDIRKMTYCLKDVANWKTWCDLSRTYTDVDWSQAYEEQASQVNVNTLAAASCSGGNCEII